MRNIIKVLMDKLLKCYSMELYSLDRSNFVSQLHMIPDDIYLTSVTQGLLKENKSYCANHYHLWKRNIKKGAKGLFAVSDGKIVGHGWLKINGAKDSFYRFGKKIAYISEIYVDRDFRGRGIAPAMISHFILDYPKEYTLYISAYASNAASKNALLKVGFSYIRSLKFVRSCKITLNKHKII